MARVEVAPQVSDDLDRIFDHLARYDLDNAPARVDEIIQAISVLETNPHIGRPARRNKRELITGRGSRGYVALYRYVPEIDTVFVLALRSQREAGYKKTRSG
ncbi:MAG TPA: type II toxin-antitoxin system RelE/ParE family toxin [Casimicrobiaceae bacterium]